MVSRAYKQVKSRGYRFLFNCKDLGPAALGLHSWIKTSPLAFNLYFKVRSSDIKKYIYIYHRKLYLRHRRLQNDTSDRVRKACARQVRNAHELFGCIKTALENEEACRKKDENYTDCKDNNASQIKRQ